MTSQPISNQQRSARKRPCRHHGITIPELLVAIGIIVILIAILLPVLNVVRSQSLMTSSMNNMRQIATWMRAYERDHRETILPSQVDYSDDDIFVNKGRVRSEPVVTGKEHHGTWADILWTINGLGPVSARVQHPTMPAVQCDYLYDAPDKALYEQDPSFRDNPFRSAAMNTTSYRMPATGVLGSAPKPHGDGAHEAGFPGFFAANDFFDARPPAGGIDDPGAPPYLGDAAPETGRWWSTGQIRAPERSMYLIDSFAGEVIAPVDNPFPAFDNRPPTGGFAQKSIEVDFRYSGNALMLMLDGSVRPEAPWLELADLEEQRGIRVRELDRRVAGP